MAAKKRTIAIAVSVLVAVFAGAYLGGLLEIANPCPQAVTLTGTGFQADFACSGVAPMKYYFDLQFAGNYGPVNHLDWSFGDGSPDLTCTAGPRGGCNAILRPTHQFTATGTFTVSLSMLDSGGHSVRVSHTLTLAGQNQPPGSPSPAITNLTVEFVGGVQAPTNLTFYAMFDGGTSPFNYSWGFGDSQTSSDGNPVHYFARGGNYTVSVTVSDAASKTASATKLVALLAPSGGTGGNQGNNTNQTGNRTARPLPVAEIAGAALLVFGVFMLLAYVRFRTVIVVLVGAASLVVGVAVFALAFAHII